MANNTILATDNFASGSLAAGWATYTAASFTAPQVVVGAPNVTEPSALSTESGVLWTGLTWPNDQTSEITTTVISEGNTYVSLMVRMQTGAYSGYKASLSAGTITCYRFTAGAGTQVAQVGGQSQTAGDIWSFSASGSSFAIYKNYKRILYFTDTTYTSGYPGYSQYTTVNLTHTKVTTWRGYNAVQQDGVWQKQGIVFPGIAADYASTGYGPQQPVVIYDTNPQILAGPNVYKMWFTYGTSPAPNTGYAESADGITWTRYSSNPVIAGKGDGSVVKVGSTYHFYGQATIGTSAIAHHTSSDGITWALQSANVLAQGGVGTWDATQIYSITAPFVVGATWNMLYSAQNAGGVWGIGLATSPDGITWTKYGSNPVMTNVIGGPVVSVNNVYYMWVGGGPVFLQSARYHSPDLITWTKDTVGLHSSEQFEGVNAQFGGSPAVSIIDLVGKASIYYIAVTNGAATIVYQIALAQATVGTNLLVTKPEDAVSSKGTDTFASGNGDLAAPWATPVGGVKLQIVAGPKVESTTTAAYNAMYYNQTFSNDQYSEVTVAALQASSDIVLMVRMQTGSFSGYEVQFSTTAASCQITSMTNGVTTAIGPTAATGFAVVVGDVFRFAVVGNVLSLYQNGFLILQVQDLNNLYTSGKPGFGFFAGTLVNAQVSAWAGGTANIIPVYSAGSGAGLLLRGVG